METGRRIPTCAWCGSRNIAVRAAVVRNAFGPNPARPWAPRRPRLLDHLRFGLSVLLAAPVLLGAFVLDHTVRHLIPKHGNAYRIIARRDRHSDCRKRLPSSRGGRRRSRGAIQPG